jgi:PGF-CTERM protein
MTAERAQEEGTVVITSVSEAALAASDSLDVTVDGEAAVEASSQAELREAADGGDSSAYMVRQSGSAEATADVLVAVNHFSERQIAVSGDDSGSSDGETTSGGSDDGDGSTDGESDSDGQPGFGVTAAVIALISVALARIRA